MTPDRIRSFDLSPDGTRMLVTADGSGRAQPWIVPLDGSAPRLIAVAGAVQRCVWLPDGTRFVALTDPDGREDNQLAVVDAAPAAPPHPSPHPSPLASPACQLRNRAH